MPMPNYQIQGAPNLMGQRKPGVFELAGDFAKSKALSAGLEAAFPGSGLAKEAGEAVLPALLNEGGRAGPLGGGQTKEGLMQARQMGALTQEEFLKAMQHAGYLEEGGKVPWWKKAAEYAWGTGRKGETARKNIQDTQKKRRPKVSAGDVGSVVASFFDQGGGVSKPGYQRMTGLTPGPLGMSDMLAAGKGKDVSKVTYKKKGGNIEDQVEIAYHAPLAAKPKGE